VRTVAPATSMRARRPSASQSHATSSEKRICESGASPGAGKVEITSPTSRTAPVSSERPSSNARISKLASTSAM